MDFLDPKKKRSNNIRLLVGYVLMGVVVSVGALILLLEVRGLSLHPTTGTVTENGLVFVDAHPESATIYLNGQDKGQTSTRLLLPVGDYAMELKRPGYRTWKRNFVLEGGSVERFAYPFLFPEKLVSKDVQSYTSVPTLASESPDRHWLLTDQPGTFNNLSVMDLTTTTNAATTVSLPQTILTVTGVNHVLQAVEWSTDNRHLLLKHTFDGGSEFIIFDRENAANSINLSRALNLPIYEISLRDKKYDQYYILDAAGGTLTAVDLKGKQNAPVGTQVLSYKSHGADEVLFATAEGAEAGKTVIKIRENLSQYVLRSVPASDRYLLDLARFDNHWYVAVGSSTEQRVYVYKDPLDPLKKSEPITPNPIAVLRTDGPSEYVSFSTIARFISVQSGGQFAVYDAETSRQYRYTTKLELAPGEKATWMDGHRLTLISNGSLVIFDYDGANQQTLLSANAAFTPFFDRDYTALFTISPSVATPARSAVVRTQLIVK